MIPLCNACLSRYQVMTLLQKSIRRLSLNCSSSARARSGVPANLIQKWSEGKNPAELTRILCSSAPTIDFPGLRPSTFLSSTLLPSIRSDQIKHTRKRGKETRERRGSLTDLNRSDSRILDRPGQLDRIDVDRHHAYVCHESLWHILCRFR